MKNAPVLRQSGIILQSKILREALFLWRYRPFFKKSFCFSPKRPIICPEYVHQGAMIMQINGSDLQTKLNVYQTNQAQARPSETKQADAAAAPVPQQDRVALSQQGQSIAEAQRAITAIPDVRESLVDQIRNDLQSGAYMVDNQKAAEGILRESLVNEAALA
jgi:flagellar biosynthesis anti-sigma factor FlgM